MLALLLFGAGALVNAVAQAQTVGGGTVGTAAEGPGPSFGVAAGGNYKLVKNWDFGASSGSTITDQATMNTHFQYHDQFGTIGNGDNYGARMVAPDLATSLTHRNQPIEGVNTDRPVREFTDNSLKTYIVPLDGATQVHPTFEKAGSGSFQAKWTAPNGGSRLGHDLIWETRVRYETPPYFWFAIWIAGNKWNRGAEIDVIESFGYDNGCNGCTNYDGDYWHSSSVGGHDDENYHSGSWRQHMENRGVFDFDATQWHTWTLLYRTDDTFATYVDGIEVQSGDLEWTLGGSPFGEALNMSFIFDGSWGHSQVSSVNKPLTAEALEDVYYEWDYSRVYYSVPVLAGDFNQDGQVDAADYTVLRDNYGAPAGTLPNDPTGSVVGSDQYAVWSANFGAVASPADGQAVPELQSASLLLVGAVAWGSSLTQKRRLAGRHPHG